MSEAFAPSLRIHRVTTRRRTLRELNCPLEPELLVAEFANELPPEVAVAVREHIAICETCGARSRALRSPYELLASLGHEPVPYVPDLRDTIHKRTTSHRFLRAVLSAGAALGRGGAIGALGIVGIVLVVVLIVGGLFKVNAQSVTRSHNALSNVRAAALSGVLLATTDKVVPVTDSAGHSWGVSEVIAVDERTGAVLHSLPASRDDLRASQRGDQPVAVAVSTDGQTIFELTAPNAHHQQALAAFDSATGALRFVTPLALPSGQQFDATQFADGLALAPDGSTVYVGVNTPHPSFGGIRVLVLNAATGQLLTELSPTVPNSVPMPPPPGSLPANVFPSVIPQLDTRPLTASVGAGGALVISSDGQWLFDVVNLATANQPAYALVRRIDVSTGITVGTLALPGDFSLAQLSVSYVAPQPATAVPTVKTAVPVTAQPAQQLYLVKGSPDAQAFVLDAGAKGPTLLGDIPLGGPAAPINTAFTGTLSVSPALDLGHLYITQNATSRNGQTSGHDLWLVDTVSMGVVTHRVDGDAADGVLANTATDQTAYTFVLRGGDADLLAPDLTGASVRWLSLGDGHHITQFLATIH